MIKKPSPEQANAYSHLAIWVTMVAIPAVIWPVFIQPQIVLAADLKPLEETINAVAETVQRNTETIEQVQEQQRMDSIQTQILVIELHIEGVNSKIRELDAIDREGSLTNEQAARRDLLQDQLTDLERKLHRLELLLPS